MKTLSISIQEKTYQELKQRVGQGQISRFIDQLVKEELERKKKRLIEDYKDAARDKDLQEEDKIWDETTGDGLRNE